MALKLRDYDLSSHIQKKPTFRKDPTSGKLIPTAKEQWLDYIEWSVIWEILTKEYSEVDFWAECHPEFTNTLKIHLTLDDKEYIMNYPIINGNAVILQPTQMDIHKAELRGFVKAVAKYTGLGLSLWQKDEFKMDDSVKNKAISTPEQSLELAEIIKTIKKSGSKEDLALLWDSLDESEQKQTKAIFTKRKQELS